MEIRPAEISEILKKQIAAFDTEANVAETGQVLSRRRRHRPRFSACRTAWPARWSSSPAPACAAWR